MLRSVEELNGEEILELKYAYLDMLQCTDDADTFKFPEDIPDDVVKGHWDGCLFDDEDFICNVQDEDAMENCGKYYYMGAELC